MMKKSAKCLTVLLGIGLCTLSVPTVYTQTAPQISIQPLSNVTIHLPNPIVTTLQGHILLSNDTIDLTLSVQAETYHFGSFRQINKVLSHGAEITKSDYPVVLQDYVVSVWSPNNTFPTTSLFYAISGTLIAPIPINTLTPQLHNRLLDDGFQKNDTQGNITYYRKVFDHSHEIKLYTK